MTSTALVSAKLSLKDKLRYMVQGQPVVVTHRGDYPEEFPDARIAGREIQLYRPPTTLDEDGHGGPGLSKELMGHYLVTVLERGIGRNLGQTDMEFGEVVGRFATVNLILGQWGEQLTFMLPIGMISMELKGALDLYMAGITEKAALAHKGTQDHTKANQLLDAASRRFEALRDGDTPQFAFPAEHMFVVAMCGRAQRTMPLRRVANTEKILDRTPSTEWDEREGA